MSVWIYVIYLLQLFVEFYACPSYFLFTASCVQITVIFCFCEKVVSII